ncbi:hypothetical protein OG225_23880 [Nocardia sp. NBC_01377]|uniref:hypothetical protein n=1 Tax=Nocardia sp. NBC_01377 TaxID=2903595 RepID=UPI00324D02D4
MRQRPTAIGYLRRDVSGVSWEWHEVRIRGMARRFGYDLADTVAAGSGADRSLPRLLELVRGMDVDAVITPSLVHLGGELPDDLLRLCEINTFEPEATYAARTPVRWEGYR